MPSKMYIFSGWGLGVHTLNEFLGDYFCLYFKGWEPLKKRVGTKMHLAFVQTSFHMRLDVKLTPTIINKYGSITWGIVNCFYPFSFSASLLCFPFFLPASANPSQGKHTEVPKSLTLNYFEKADSSTVTSLYNLGDHPSAVFWFHVQRCLTKHTHRS